MIIQVVGFRSLNGCFSSISFEAILNFFKSNKLDNPNQHHINFISKPFPRFSHVYTTSVVSSSNKHHSYQFVIPSFHFYFGTDITNTTKIEWEHY